LTPFPWDDPEGSRDQYIAMRKDAAALAEAYGERLRSRIVPGYRAKRQRVIDNGVIFDPAAAPAAREKRSRELPQLLKNEAENDEQYELTKSLRRVRRSLDVSMLVD